MWVPAWAPMSIRVRLQTSPFASDFTSSRRTGGSPSNVAIEGCTGALMSSQSTRTSSRLAPEREQPLRVRDDGAMMNRAGTSTARVETISAELLVDAHTTLGEGPIWDDAERCLWWVDILEGIVHRTDPATGDDERHPVGQFVGAIGLRRSGGLVAAVRDGFATFDPITDRLELIADLQDDGRTLRMNDGKVDPGGRFWAGMMAIDHRDGAGTLYRLDPDGTVEPMVRGTSISNGLDWSPDAMTMYYIDSTPRTVDRFAYDAATGDISDRTTLIPIRDGAGFPDGMTV